MSRGKEICMVLKDVRRRIAEENGIAMDIPECTFKGECRGTCPRCEAELHYLDSQLRDRRRTGRAVKIAGIAAGALALLSPADIYATEPTDTVSEEVIMILNGEAPRHFDDRRKNRIEIQKVNVINTSDGVTLTVIDDKGNTLSPELVRRYLILHFADKQRKQVLTTRVRDNIYNINVLENNKIYYDRLLTLLDTRYVDLTDCKKPIRVMFIFDNGNESEIDSLYNFHVSIPVTAIEKYINKRKK